jgi:hypothetical protein
MRLDLLQGDPVPTTLALSETFGTDLVRGIGAILLYGVVGLLLMFAGFCRASSPSWCTAACRTP